MIDLLVQRILQQLQQPKKDIEQNVRALLVESLSKMDVVSQQELERQQQALHLANQRLNQLQQQLNELQAKVNHNSPSS